jgi:preprotein translocase subunit SecF
VSNGRASGRSGALVGAGGLFLALCCVVVPVIFGVVIGTTIGGVLDVIAAVLVAVGVALMLHRRRASKGQRC